MTQDLSAPAWQTDDLLEEWPDDDNDNDGYNDDNSSISLTTPLASHLQTISELGIPQVPQNPTHNNVGTFLVHQDAPRVPILAKTPGRQKRGNIKDFFSPLPLERMFEPPSPPLVPAATTQPHPLSHSIVPATPSEQPTSQAQTVSDEILETDLPNMRSFDGRKPSLACQFTFSAPLSNLQPPRSPMAESTPLPPTHTNPPMTDPRLRLFQFQYDTFTRDHLSAMVDSIAINTPSGSTPSPQTFNHVLSRVSEVTGTIHSPSQYRSTKRVKLSPASDYEPVVRISRPRMMGKDYVSSSETLMQQIKKARDLSTISTVRSVSEAHASNHDTPKPSYGECVFID